MSNKNTMKFYGVIFKIIFSLLAKFLTYYSDIIDKKVKYIFCKIFDQNKCKDISKWCKNHSEVLIVSSEIRYVVAIVAIFSSLWILQVKISIKSLENYYGLIFLSCQLPSNGVKITDCKNDFIIIPSENWRCFFQCCDYRLIKT